MIIIDEQGETLVNLQAEHLGRSELLESLQIQIQCLEELMIPLEVVGTIGRLLAIVGGERSIVFPLSPT